MAQILCNWHGSAVMLPADAHLAQDLYDPIEPAQGARLMGGDGQWNPHKLAATYFSS